MFVRQEAWALFIYLEISNCLGLLSPYILRLALLGSNVPIGSVISFVLYFLASPDALEVIVVSDSLTDWSLGLTWLMWPWWVMIPIEDLTDVTLAIEDTDEDDEEDLTDVTLVSDDMYLSNTWLMLL